MKACPKMLTPIIHDDVDGVSQRRLNPWLTTATEITKKLLVGSVKRERLKLLTIERNRFSLFTKMPCAEKNIGTMIHMAKTMSRKIEIGTRLALICINIPKTKSKGVPKVMRTITQRIEISTACIETLPNQRRSCSSF